MWVFGHGNNILLVLPEVALSPASRVDTCSDSGSDVETANDRGETQEQRCRDTVFHEPGYVAHGTNTPSHE